MRVNTMVALLYKFYLSSAFKDLYQRNGIDCLERLVSKMTCYVMSSGTLNSTHIYFYRRNHYWDWGCQSPANMQSRSCENYKLFLAL